MGGAAVGCGRRRAAARADASWLGCMLHAASHSTLVCTRIAHRASAAVPPHAPSPVGASVCGPRCRPHGASRAPCPTSLCCQFQVLAPRRFHSIAPVQHHWCGCAPCGASGPRSGSGQSPATAGALPALAAASTSACADRICMQNASKERVRRQMRAAPRCPRVTFTPGGSWQRSWWARQRQQQQASAAAGVQSVARRRSM